MSQPEEVGKRFFLMQANLIKGVVMIEQTGDEFIPWHQTEPLGNRVYLAELSGDHSRTVFHRVIEYFKEMRLAIQTIPDAVSKETYRDSLWRLFLENGLLGKLAKTFRAELRQSAQQPSNTKNQLIRKQIQYLITMSIEKDDMTMVDLWESWLKEWSPYED